MPKVTVVIPAYNSMAYLPETLDSVLNQTFSDFEVLIINDGSSDNIIEWIAGITDSRVKLISQTNQGVAAARNTGINKTEAEYIAFLDADDLWEPTKLEKQVHCFESKPEIGLVYTWTLLVDQQGQSMNIVIAAKIEGKVWEKLLVGDVVGNGSSAMVRREYFARVGLFDPELPNMADCDMWAWISAYYPIAVIKEVLVHYRQCQNSMSKNYEKMLQDSRLTIEKRFKQVPFELLHLRSQAYGHALLWLAWKIMFDGGDLKQVNDFAQQAALHYPPTRYFTKYLRLQLMLKLFGLCGSNYYMQLRDLKQKLRGGAFQFYQ